MAQSAQMEVHCGRQMGRWQLKKIDHINEPFSLFFFFFNIQSTVIQKEYENNLLDFELKSKILI